MGEPVAAVVVVALSAVLVASAVGKAVAPGTARNAVQSLGVSRHAGTMVGAAVFVEWATAVGLVLYPRSWYPLAGLVALFAMFAAAATRALAKGQTLECGCFGSVTSQRLGRPQLYEFAAVVCCASGIAWNRPWWAPSDGLRLLVLVHLVVAATFLAVVVPTWLVVRRDRISLAAGRAFQRPMEQWGRVDGRVSA